jgi:hypothetical protein
MTNHVAREHPPVERISKMTNRELWAYVLDELEFLSTPEQKRVPTALAAAMRELSHRDRRA